MRPRPTAHKRVRGICWVPVDASPCAPQSSFETVGESKLQYRSRLWPIQHPAPRADPVSRGLRLLRFPRLAEDPKGHRLALTTEAFWLSKAHAELEKREPGI